MINPADQVAGRLTTRSRNHPDTRLVYPYTVQLDGKGTLMSRRLIMFAAMLVPTGGMAAEPGGVQGMVRVSGHVPASCRAASSVVAGAPAWSCNGPITTTVIAAGTGDDGGGAAFSRLTVRPVI
jgi:hypothetical protein